MYYENFASVSLFYCYVFTFFLYFNTGYIINFCISLVRDSLYSLKARANARNIVGQQDATLLGPTCYERLHTMLCVVATCWKVLDEV